MTSSLYLVGGRCDGPWDVTVPADHIFLSGGLLPPVGSQVLFQPSPDQKCVGGDGDQVHVVYEVLRADTVDDDPKWTGRLEVRALTLPEPKSYTLMHLDLVYEQGLPDFSVAYGQAGRVPELSAAAIRDHLGIGSALVAV